MTLDEFAKRITAIRHQVASMGWDTESVEIRVYGENGIPCKVKVIHDDAETSLSVLINKN